MSQKSLRNSDRWPVPDNFSNEPGVSGSGLFRHYGTNTNPGTSANIKATPYVRWGADPDFVVCGETCVMRIDWLVGEIVATGSGTIPFTSIASCYDDRIVTRRYFVDGSQVYEFSETRRFWGKQCLTAIELDLEWRDIESIGTPAVSFSGSSLTVL
jgi:hypothetical protein